MGDIRKKYVQMSLFAFPEEQCEASKEIFDNSKKEKWLTTKEAAQYLRVSSKRLLNLSSNGKVKHYKFGRSNRYLESELRELLLAEPRGVSND